MNAVTRSVGSPLTTATFFSVTRVIVCLNIYWLWNSLYWKDFRINNFTCSCFPVLSSVSRPGEWVWEGRFLGQALSVKPKLLSVLLCVWTEKLLGVLIQYSVQGEVSDPHVKYMESGRFYLCVCGLGCSCCQNKMTHFRSDVLRTEEPSCQPTDLHVCVSARVNHAYSIILFFQPWPTNLFLKKKKGGRAVKSIFTPSNLNRVLPIWTLLCPVEIHGNIPRRLGWVGTEWEGARCGLMYWERLSLQLIQEPGPDKAFKHVPNFRQ